MLALLLLLPADAADDFFEAKVRPALVQHCFGCHSGKKRRGGLLLDSRAAMLKGGDTGPALVPGDPQKSRLIAAMPYKDVELQMPPRGKVPDAVLSDLTKWVSDGARWPGGDRPAVVKEAFDLAGRKASHWAWKPLSDPAVPSTAGGWARTSADRFLLAELQKAKLEPAKDADRPTLLRRLHFDLVGLPPSPDDVEAFLKDGRPDAVERVVDRLLTSPRFGEKWGRHWLDLVRYAETRGHEFDPVIPNAHQYRDYVVRALNDDVPYDRFVLEHLAGDLLPSPRLHGSSNESVLGTGFWFLGEEVHSPVDIRADQADRFDNRIDVMSKTFLGLTVSCARCHDHKFDAISAKDYYALYGFLTSSNYRQVRFDGWERNRDVMARLAALREEHAARLPKVEMKPPTDPPHGTTVVDYADLKPGQWLPDDVGFGPGPAKAGEYRIGRVVERTAAEFDPFWSRLKDAPGSEAEPSALGGNRSGRTIRTPGFVVSPGRAYALVRGAGRLYAAVGAHVMVAGPLHGRLVQGIGPSKSYRWVGVDLSPYEGQPAHLEFTAGSDDFAVARVIESASAPPAPATVKVPPVSADFAAWRDAEAELAKEAVFVSRVAPAMQDGTGMDEAVFVRGSHKTPGVAAPRRFLEALAGDKPLSAKGSGRLELAKQIVDPATTPLTPRVVVNRLWHHLFGRGIAPSVDDFGVMGTPPTHPELLDHLATRFVREGWSLKRTVREMVLSRAYAMSSDPTPADKADPENRLLHRANLRRLSAEAIRNALLTTLSGELRPTMFGPSTPVHLTEFQDGRGRPTSGPIDGAGRRSLYLGVRRNFLSSFLLAFDAPSPFSTVGRRTVSNVPAQSLILMNDPFVQQQSGLWAKRSSGVTRMYLAAFGRPPSAEEREACEAFLKGATAAELAHSLVNVKEFVFLR